MRYGGGMRRGNGERSGGLRRRGSRGARGNGGARGRMLHLFAQRHNDLVEAPVANQTAAVRPCSQRERFAQ